MREHKIKTTKELGSQSLVNFLADHPELTAKIVIKMRQREERKKAKQGGDS